MKHLDPIVERLFEKGRVEDIAHELKLSVSTVFKWKAGMTQPSPMAKEKIYLYLANGIGRKDE